MTIIDLKTKQRKKINYYKRQEYKGFIGTIETQGKSVVFIIKKVFK